jgi:hypothetical protein
MQQWQRDLEELGERAYYERRAENARGPKNRLWAILSRFPFLWFEVTLDTGGTVRVQSSDGWPGPWKDSVIGHCKAKLISDYDGVIQ